MSQAIIDFCDRLKTTLLSLEEQLDHAKKTLDSNAAGVQGEAQKHVDEAVNLLAQFRANAGDMIESIGQDVPEKSGALREKLKSFGADAQVALRHAAIFAADAVSKGADTAASALQSGAKRAQDLAQDLRHQTAVTVKE